MRSWGFAISLRLCFQTLPSWGLWYKINKSRMCIGTLVICALVRERGMDDICIATNSVQHFASIVLVLPPLVHTCCNRSLVLEVIYSVWRDEYTFCFVPGFIYQYPSWNLYFSVHSWLFVFHGVLAVEVCFPRVSVWLRILFDFLVWAEKFPWA